ncbi:MAG: hypothetical protein ACOC8E_02695 [Planctomycetota bacterium]
MADTTLKLLDLAPDEIPEKLRPGYYFDFDEHPFEHAEFVASAPSVIHVLERIRGYLAERLPALVESADAAETRTPADYPGRSTGEFRVLLEEDAVFEPAFVVGGDAEPSTLLLRRGAKVLGASLWLDHGDVVLGADTVVEPGVGVKGPAIVGRQNELRLGTYLRGKVLIGDGCKLRGEIKNTVLMNRANYPHPSYLGDSLCGYKSHFGNQATSANLKVFDLVERKTVTIELDGTEYDLGRRKVGIVMGDCAQVGCNSVSDPGVFLAPWVVCYQLTRLKKGFYGPDEVMKNKPLEHGVMEFAPLRRDKTKKV